MEEMADKSGWRIRDDGGQSTKIERRPMHRKGDWRTGHCHTFTSVKDVDIAASSRMGRDLTYIVREGSVAVRSFLSFEQEMSADSTSKR